MARSDCSRVAELTYQCRRAQLTPPVEGVVAVQLEDGSRRKAAFRVEEVVEGGVDVGKILQLSHSSEAGHCCSGGQSPEG